MFTTNKPLMDWGAALHDYDLAAPLRDRPLHQPAAAPPETPASGPASPPDRSVSVPGSPFASALPSRSVYPEFTGYNFRNRQATIVS